jgi:hypothetical protein
MRPVNKKILCFAALLLFLAAAVKAQDPRVGLKAGFHDAGTAIHNLELVWSVPKPDGFFDPKAPAGTPVPPEPPNAENEPPPAVPPEPPAPGTPAAAAAAAAAARLNFTNSDLAFSHDHLIMGNFNGFNTYNIEDQKKARVVVSVVCPGGQGDVSIYGNLLFMSVEQTRGRIDCGTQGVQAPISNERFRGVRIFDITDMRKPRQVAAVQTCRGSHTHTLVIDPRDKTNVYIYGQGTAQVRSAQELAGCSNEAPEKDANTALFSIDVIQVPVAAPQNAKIVNRPRIFADPNTGAIAGLWAGGNHGPGTQRTSVTNQCHDITVFPEAGLAAGACSGNGILLDISDPVHPVRLDQVVDKNFAFWHSATFNNDGTKVIFTDEWGGGTRPRCRASDPPSWGADAIFDIVNKKLQFKSYFKIPAAQTEQENCVAHNGSLIPVPGRDIMVQGWYQGGLSVFDFTNSEHPVEIAYFDRGPIDAKDLIVGGYWSAYWYNGQIYASEIARGLDAFRLKPSELLSQNEIDAAMLAHTNELNVQTQSKVVWPASPAVARAYLDQLSRSNAMPPDRVRAITDALAHAAKIRSSHDKNAAAVVKELNSLTNQIEGDAAKAGGRDSVRMQSLATTMKGISGRF